MLNRKVKPAARPAPSQPIAMPSSKNHSTGAHSPAWTRSLGSQPAPTLRRKGGDASHTEAPASVHQTLRSSGQPLDASTRAFMEPRFGQDLSHVRVHTDSQAAQSAADVSARAYTVGQNVVFGAEQYAPSSSEGQKLLAHELTHVMQQGNAASGQLLQRDELQISPESAALLGSLTLDRFELNSSVLTARQRSRLRLYAQVLRSILRQYPTGRIQLVGHTDLTGEESHNTTLGQLRADSVKIELILEGIPANLMVTNSAGESAPRIPTDQREPLNRRVEASFSAGASQTPSTTPRPAIDLRLHDLPHPPDPGQLQLPDWFWDPSFPSPVPRSSVTFNQTIYNMVDSALNPILRPLKLPAWLRDRVIEGAHDLVDRGLESAFDSALDAAHIEGETRDAIKSTVQGVRQQPIPTR